MILIIPLKDSTKANRFPIVNVTLIVINVLIFIFQLGLSENTLNLVVYNFGVIPKVYTTNPLPALFISNPYWIVPLFSSMFFHGGLLHILGNMLYLWVFGDNVEDKLGHGKYLIFYLAVGLLANIAHIMTNPLSTVPTIGASGAVAGVLGAYFLAFPKAKVVALIPIIFFFTVATVPAVVFLFLWFGFQLLSGLTSFGAGQMVAWWAHIGGFVAGAILWMLFRPQYMRIKSY